jgi:hypothetical protein
MKQVRVFDASSFASISKHCIANDASHMFLAKYMSRTYGVFFEDVPSRSHGIVNLPPGRLETNSYVGCFFIESIYFADDIA